MLVPSSCNDSRKEEHTDSECEEEEEGYGMRAQAPAQSAGFWVLHVCPSEICLILVIGLEDCSLVRLPTWMRVLLRKSGVSVSCIKMPNHF